MKTNSVCFLFIFITLCLLSCVSAFKTDSVKRIPARQESLSIKTELLSFERLLNTIKQTGAKNVEEALAAVSKQYPDYLKFHTLMYDSLSLHESSMLEPRVIVYGPRGDFILTFNGNTKMRSGNSLEMMQYNHSSGQFQFRELKFKSPTVDEPVNLISQAEIEFENEQFRLTKPNPGVCVACHTESTRPIFDTYFLWPGAYGSNDDILTSTYHKKEFLNNPNYNGVKIGESLGRLIKKKNGFSDVEATGFLKFIANKQNHPRYKYLPDRGVDTAFRRLNAGELKDLIDTTEAVAEEFEQLGVPSHLSYIYARPNLALNTLLYDLVVKSFVTKAISNDATKTLPFKLAWILQCSRDGNSLLGPLDNFKSEKKDPVVTYQEILSSKEIEDIRNKSGNWKEFFIKFVSDELEMQAEKFKRLEKTFGQNSLELTENANYNQIGSRDLVYYEAIKGRKLDKFEEMAAYDESDEFYIEASLSYISKGLGLDTKMFATNLRRVASFRESGFNSLATELMNRHLINPVSSYYNLKDACPDLLLKAHAK